MKRESQFVQDAREKLYQLLAKDYVWLQEVPKAMDHAPSHTIYLWGVRLQQVGEHMNIAEPMMNGLFVIHCLQVILQLVTEIYKVMKNLKMRIQDEREACKDILQKEAEVANVFTTTSRCCIHFSSQMKIAGKSVGSQWGGCRSCEGPLRARTGDPVTAAEV
jgi:hypothetical protein